MELFFSIIIYSFFSITLLLLIHNVILFLFDTLTIPKSKDMIKIISKNYENIHKILLNVNDNFNYSSEITPINLLPNLKNNVMNNKLNDDDDNNNDSDDTMKNELENYLRNEINI